MYIPISGTQNLSRRCDLGKELIKRCRRYEKGNSDGNILNMVSAEICMEYIPMGTILR